jgi:hypothetical protein
MMKLGKRQCRRNVDTIVTGGSEFAGKLALEATQCWAAAGHMARLFIAL